MNTILQCGKGHDKTVENTFGKNQCRICHKAAVAAYEKTDTCQMYRKQQAQNPAKKEYRRKYYLSNKAVFRALHFKNKYGLSMEQLAEMFAKQNGKCAICGIPGSETIKGLVVDHKRGTKEVRGLLCNICNSHVVHVVEYYSHLLDRAKSYLGGF